MTLCILDIPVSVLFPMKLWTSVLHLILKLRKLLIKKKQNIYTNRVIRFNRSNSWFNCEIISPPSKHVQDQPISPDITHYTLFILVDVSLSFYLSRCVHCIYSSPISLNAAWLVKTYCQSWHIYSSLLCLILGIKYGSCHFEGWWPK